MQTVESRVALASALELWTSGKLPYAFVPTMGALHEGHLTLIRKARLHYPRVLASVFVNPTQFDRASDLAAYPRQPTRDAELLAAAGTDLLFLPSTDEIYSSDYVTPPLPDLAGLDTRYEGERRPGHFAGVVQVVRRLVQLVHPRAMFMGQKDAQQVAVLRRAAVVEAWPLEIIAVPTVREASGLAMSSRNGRLSDAGFAKACRIYHTMQWAQVAWRAGEHPLAIRRQGIERLQDAGFETEYFDVVDAATFEPLQRPFDPLQAGLSRALLITVAWLEGVRLIDNLEL